MVVVAGDGLNPIRDQPRRRVPDVPVAPGSGARRERALPAHPARPGHPPLVDEGLPRRAAPPAGVAADGGAAVRGGARRHGERGPRARARRAGPSRPTTGRGRSTAGTCGRCGVVLSDLEAGGTEDYKIGLFTERRRADRPDVNQELLHFGRAHCDGLLAQAGARVRAERVSSRHRAARAHTGGQIARWIERVRSGARTSQTVPARRRRPAAAGWRTTSGSPMPGSRGPSPARWTATARPNGRRQRCGSRSSRGRARRGTCGRTRRLAGSPRRLGDGTRK